MIISFTSGDIREHIDLTYAIRIGRDMTLVHIFMVDGREVMAPIREYDTILNAWLATHGATTES